MKVSSTTIIINAFALLFLILAFINDKRKSKEALKVALKSFLNILPTTIIIIFAIGYLLTFIPPSAISKFVGEQAGFGGTIAVSLLGAVLFIPSVISFPLAGSLLQSGASVTSVAAFITTLTMIGFVTLPLEIKILGKKFAALRNGFSYIVALLISFLMGVILR